MLGTVFSVSTNAVWLTQSQSAHFEIHFQIAAQSVGGMIHLMTLKTEGLVVPLALYLVSSGAPVPLITMGQCAPGHSAGAGSDSPPVPEEVVPVFVSILH